MSSNASTPRKADAGTGQWLPALLLSIAAFAGPALSPLSDPDVWWHLKAGTEFLSGGPLPFRDTWSCTAQGRPWINHEWLAEVFLALARRIGGETGVVLLGALVLALAAFFIFRAAHRDGLPPAFIAILSCLGALAISDRLLPRPQIFTYLCLALLLERLGAIRRGASPWMLPVLQLLWTNLHGPWVGLSSGSLLLLGGALPDFSWRRRWKLIGFLALASLMHPQTYRVLIEPLPRLLGGGLYRQTIQEWLPIQHPVLRAIPQAPAAFLIMGLGAAAGIVGLFTSRRRAWGYGAFLIALSLAPFVSSRNRDLICVALVPGIAFLFGDLRSLRARRAVSTALLVLSSVLILVPQAGFLHYPAAWPWRWRLSRANCPEGAVAFLNREGVGARMFNAYDYGGFLIDQLHTKRLDFIDGRLIIGEDVYRDYLEVQDGSDRSRMILDRYDVDLLVIRYPQPGGYQDLAARARDWPDWAFVFWDDATVVFVRRARVRPAWLQAHAYRWLDPTLPPIMRTRAYWVDHSEDLLEEAERAAKDAPRAARPVLAEALTYEYNGRPQDAARAYRRVLEMHPENRPAREGLSRLERGPR
jgi:hypothetical protein